jgi:hypothetical protein
MEGSQMSCPHVPEMCEVKGGRGEGRGSGRC